MSDKLGITRSQYTTQIEHYDNLGALFDNMKRINVARVIYAEIFGLTFSMEYF